MSDLDAPMLYEDLREEDMMECIGLMHHPRDAVYSSFEASSKCYSVKDCQDGLLACFGVSPRENIGIAWLLRIVFSRNIRGGNMAQERGLIGYFRRMFNLDKIDDLNSALDAYRALNAQMEERIKDYESRDLEFRVLKLYVESDAEFDELMDIAAKVKEYRAIEQQIMIPFGCNAGAATRPAFLYRLHG